MAGGPPAGHDGRVPRLRHRTGKTIGPAMLGLAVLFALALPAPAPAAFGYLGQWGGSGPGDGKFQAAFGIATDASGNVYVADCSRHDVQKFDQSGAFLAKWGSGPGPGNGQFNCPRDVAVDSTGVYVVDFYNNRVQKFDTSGGYLSQFDNAAHGTFDQPVGVAADGLGHVYVIDTSATDNSNQRLQRFDTNGTWQALIGSAGSGPGQYGKPYGVTTGTGGSIFVSDQGNNRVVGFTAAGAAGPTWGSFGTGDGQFGGLQQGLDADGNGDVYVADYTLNRFQKFSPTGAFLGKWGTTGSGDYQLSGPMDVASGASGVLYVLDSGNNRVVKYGEGAVALPTVATSAATSVKWSTATLNGTVNPQGTATSYRFEYGETTAYGSNTTATSAGTGSADVPASAALTGLAAERTYHYRLVALRGDTVVATGADMTFKTAPDPGGATGCGRVGHVVGVVSVCADDMTYDAGRWTASGNVILNTGLSVSGAVVINDSLADITSTGSVTVKVERSPAVEIGSGPLHITAAGVTDPTSNRSGLGVMTIGNPLGMLLGGVPFAPLLSHYVDATDGGGVILTGRPSFDLLGPLAGAALPTGSFSVGIHRTHARPFNVLGGSVTWSAIQLSSAWKIGFSVGYAEGPPSLWSAMGKFEAPFLPAGTGAELTGAFSGGALDQVGIKISTPGVPLGTTGIIMDTFGGSLKGLSGGADNPLIISVLVAGGWTKTNLPDPFNWILHIKDVTLSINTAGSGSLSGGVAVLDGEGRLAGGTASLTIQLSPSFQASGNLNVSFNAVAVSANLAAWAAMNRYHFTALGTVSGSVLGTTVGSASGVISDKGIGATTSVCVPYWTPWDGWEEWCGYVGAGLTWRNVSSIPPEVDWIGSNINQYVTVTASARAAAATRRFTVDGRDPFLYVEARGEDARNFELVSPFGIRYRPGSKRRDTFSQTIGDVTGIVVYGPPKGTWLLRSTAAKRTRFSVKTIPELGRIKPRAIRPASSKKRPLGSKVKRIRLAWRGSKLPRDTRVSLYVSSSKKAPGKRLTSKLRASGTTTVKLSSLAKGANYLHLVPRSGGVEFAAAYFPKPVWKR